MVEHNDMAQVSTNQTGAADATQNLLKDLRQTRPVDGPTGTMANGPMVAPNDTTQTGTTNPGASETTQNLLKDVNEARAKDQLTGMMSNSLARRGYALAEGVSLLPHGAWNAAKDLWDNPSQLFNTAVGGAAFGIGMRALGPEAFAAKSVITGVMTAMMVRDVAKPLANTWIDAGNAKTMADVHLAANTLGDGLGNFAVDTGIAIGAGLGGEKLAGRAFKGTASGRAFESWRDARYKQVGKLFGTGDAAAAANAGLANETAKSATADQTSAAGQGRETRLDREPANDNEIQRPTEPGAGNKHSMIGGDVVPDRSFGGTAGLDRPTADNPGGHIASANVERILDVAKQVQARRQGQQLHRHITEIIEQQLSEGSTPAIDETPNSLSPIRVSPDHAPHDPPPFSPNLADQLVETFKVSDKPTAGTMDKTSQAVGDLAVTVRDALGAVDQNVQAVKDFQDRNAGPINSVLRDKPAVDAAHVQNNQHLLALTNQISGVDEAKEVGSILDHYVQAYNQMGLEQEDIRALNLFSEDTHKILPKWLADNGIPKGELLDHHAPHFVIYPVDSPYTIPPIDIPGPDGKVVPLTTAGVVAFPRPFEKVPDVLMPANYHEIAGHNDAYRRMFRLPADLRDEVLTEHVVAPSLRRNGFDPHAIVEIPIVKNPARATLGSGDIAGNTGAIDGDEHLEVRGGKPRQQDKAATETLKMPLGEFVVKVLLKQANENTSDIMAELIDPNMGFCLANLLASLRPPSELNPSGPGLLETRSIYGSRTADPSAGDNLGLEVHGIDRWRVKGAAEMLRWQAEYDSKVADATTSEAIKLKSATMKAMKDRADQYDKMADAMSVPGDEYLWVNTDAKGSKIAIPQKVLDGLLPDLIKAQMETPMPKSLAGKSFADIVPTMWPTFNKISGLAERMADAARKGETDLTDFDHKKYSIGNVFSAGLQASIEAIEANPKQGAAGHIAPDQLLARVMQISRNVREAYLTEQATPHPDNVVAMPARDIGDQAAVVPPVVAEETAMQSTIPGDVRTSAPSPYKEIAHRAGNFVLRNGATISAAYGGGQISNWYFNPKDDPTMGQRIQDLLLNNQDQIEGQEKRGS